MVPSRIFLFVLISLVILCSACSQQPTRSASLCPPGKFAIYLTAKEMNGAGILRADLSTLELQDQPAISSEEIISYEAKTRELRLIPEALKRLSESKVPLDGRAFVACAEGRPLFVGAFWSYLSSLSYEGVSLMVPVPDMQTVHLESGYPTSRFANGSDPLQDPQVLKALQRENKLR